MKVTNYLPRISNTLLIKTSVFRRSSCDKTQMVWKNLNGFGRLQ